MYQKGENPPWNARRAHLKRSLKWSSISKNWPLPFRGVEISQTNTYYQRGRDINMSEWVGCFCLQCIREKEVGVVEDLGE